MEAVKAIGEGSRRTQTAWGEDNTHRGQQVGSCRFFEDVAHLHFPRASFCRRQQEGESG